MTVSRELRMEERRRQREERARINAEAEAEERAKQEALARRSKMPEVDVLAEVRRESIENRQAHAARQSQAYDGPVPGRGYRTPGSVPRAKMQEAPQVENKMEVLREEDLQNKTRSELVALAEERGLDVVRQDGKNKPPTKLDYIAALCS